MLSIFKNNIFGSALHGAGTVQQKELDWYLSNYWIIASQAAVLAGFASQALGQLDSNLQPFYVLGTLQISLTAVALMAEIYVIVAATFCCIWAPCLALRGSGGLESARKAVEILEKLLHSILATFLLGLFSFIMSSLIALLASSKTEKTANRSIVVMVLTGVIIMGITANTVRIFYYSTNCRAAVESFEKGETIGDLDNTPEAQYLSQFQ